MIKTILFIEDDRFIGEMYVCTLKHEGYTVDWMVDGNDGLVAAYNRKYDLILLDIMLPERRGSEILQALRPAGGKDQIPGTKVIVLTNFDQDEASRNAMTAQVDGYFIKAEITPRRLLEIIKSFNS